MYSRWFIEGIRELHDIMMKTTVNIFIILLLTSFVNNSHSIWPNSRQTGRFSTITNLEYNAVNGFQIYNELTVDESKVFKQKYNKYETTVWSLDTISPTMIPADRELAYKYYSEIPGVVWIEKNLFCDETEIANIHWQEFLFYKGKLQDINKGKSKDLVELGYYTRPQFYFFPVTEISYEDVIEFCKWRSYVVTKNYNLKHGNTINSPEYTIFEFNLPTEREWIKCASFAIDTIKYKNIFKDSLVTLKINTDNLIFLNKLGSSANKLEIDNFNKNIKKDYILNCFRPKNDFLNLITPFYVWSNPTNQFGIYNILGNVSEMIIESGVAKGGSFTDTFANCNPNRRIKYSKPERNIGFRCVCKLKWPNQK